MHRRHVLLIGSILGLAACGGDNTTSSTSSRTMTSTAPTIATTESSRATLEPSASTTAVAMSLPPSVELGGSAWSTVHGFGGAWIQVDPPVDQLVKVDEASGEITLRIDGGRGVAVADDAVWVVVDGVETRKMDPMTGEVLVVVQTPDANYVTVGAGSVWVPAPGGISRIDPSTGDLVVTIPVEDEVTDLVATDDAVWLTHKDAGTVTRIDAATNTVVAEILTGAGAHDLAVGDDAIWITNYRANTVSRIDPATNTVVATLEGVGSGVGIEAGGDSIYVSTQYKGISRIDPATNVATPIAAFPEWNYGVAYGDGELWVSSVDEGLVYRLDLPAD